MTQPDPLEGYVSPMPAHVVTPEILRHPETEEQRADRIARHLQLAALLRQWMTEDPEYDERVGKILLEELEIDRFRLREADDPAA